ncbi:MAG: DUF2141 domain-containing protein [Pirellula sp.]
MFDFAKRNSNLLLACCVLTLCLGCETKQTTNQTTSNQTATAEQAPKNSKSESAIEPAKPVETPSVIQVPITIEVTGFQNAEGNCRMAIFLGADRFNDPDFAIAKEVVAITKGQVTWDSTLDIPLERINPGDSFSLAVSAYHDQNDNQKLDKNALGMPLERYGFSNNPKRGFGPPKYRETSIQVPVPSDSGSTDPKPLSIQIQIK